MGFRFRKSIKILPGLKLNLSKSGVSANVGVPGANVSLGSRGSHVNLGIPGSGVSYRERIGGDQSNEHEAVSQRSEQQSSGISPIVWMLIGAAIAVLVVLVAGSK